MTESEARAKGESDEQARASLAELAAQVRASLEAIKSRQDWFAFQDRDFLL
ncbi:hypothetical protein [Saccharopolyspora hattusasensis]|uniref:hypothetical protein n=1 Tax=Saccharopolyspora hattusasensis TaxID=1128679 RepID=UPI003D95CE36